MHKIVLRFTHKLIQQPYRDTEIPPTQFPQKLLPWLFKGHRRVQTGGPTTEGPVAYSFTCDVPLEINVVPPEKAEAVELKTDPSLSSTVRSAVTTKPGTGASGDDSASVSGGIDMVINNPPVDFAFRAVVKDASGKAIPMNEQYGQFCIWPMYDGPLETPPSSNTVVVLRGQKRVLWIWPYAAALRDRAPEVYSGTVELVPDEPAAYKDPRVKSIWGGKLTFPIGYTLYKRRAAATQRQNGSLDPSSQSAVLPDFSALPCGSRLNEMRMTE